MDEKSIKNCKSLLVFPGIVRSSDKGCLKKKYFPFANYHSKRFPLRIVLAGEVTPVPLSMASKTFLLWVFGMKEQGSSKQYCTPVAKGQIYLSVTVAQISTNPASAAESHRGAESGHSAADPPEFYLWFHDLCQFSFNFLALGITLSAEEFQFSLK